MLEMWIAGARKMIAISNWIFKKLLNILIQLLKKQQIKKQISNFTTYINKDLPILIGLPILTIL